MLLLAATLAALVFRRKNNRQLDEVTNSLLVSENNHEFFVASMVADLPDVVQRYFLHAIAPGTPLSSSVNLKMSGAFRLNPSAAWMPMTGEETLNLPHGFVWRASMGKGLMKFSGADYYFQGSGRVNFGLWGLIPVANASGPDTARSSIGRFVGEAFWLPSSLLPQRGVKWQAIDGESAKATVVVDGEPVSITFGIAPNGQLRHISLSRWGDKTIDGSYGYAPFGGEMTAERKFGGYTIPSELGAGWWFGTDHYFEFFRVKIEEAIFDPRQ